MAVQRLIKLQHRHESLLRDLDRADALHAPLALFLLFEQFALTGYVTAITLRKHVLAHRGDRLAGDDLPADRGLDGHLVELSRNDGLQLLHQPPALCLRLAAVGDDRQRVHRLAGHQDVDLDQLTLAESDHLVVHRRVALGARLQLVVEVVDDLAERDLVLQDHAVAGPVLKVLEGPAPVLTELYHRTDVSRGDDDRELDERFGDALDHGRLRQRRRIVDLDDSPAAERHLVLDGRRGGDELQLELSLQALLDDFQMQQAEEATAKPETKGRRVLGLVGERSVVELELLERLLEVAELV